MAPSDILRSRQECDLYRDRAELDEILNMPDDSYRLNQLSALATRLGASTISVSKGYGEASQPELVHNIQVAMQTKAMIAAVTTSSNYVIVTVILALISFLSMVVSVCALVRSLP